MIEFRFGRSLSEIEREMDRLLAHYGQQKRLPVQFRQRIWHPLVNLYETPDLIVALIELAGVNEHDVEVVVDNLELVVRGRRPDTARDELQAYHVMEINEGPFERAIPLPAKVDSSRTTAEFKGGMLEICMPKLRDQAISIRITSSEG